MCSFGRIGRVAGPLAACALVLLGPPARAETLAEAIALAYQANPTLQSQRAQLRATDEDYVQARAGWRPTLSASAVVDHVRGPQNSLFGPPVETTNDTGQLGLTASQPLYTGGGLGPRSARRRRRSDPVVSSYAPPKRRCCSA